MTSLRPPAVRELPVGKKLLATLAVFLVSFLSVLPQITVTVQSFRKTNGPLFVSGFSFDSYIAVWSKAKQSITNTFLYAVIALAIIIVLSLLGAYLIVRRKSFFTNLIDVLLMFPLCHPRCGARHLPDRRVQQRRDPADRQYVDHHYILYYPQAAVYDALKRGYFVSDRQQRGGGLDQSRRAADAHVLQDDGASDAAGRAVRRGAQLRERHQYAQRDAASARARPLPSRSPSSTASTTTPTDRLRRCPPS